MGLNILEAAEACNQIYLDPAKTGSKIGDWSLVHRINSPHDDMTGNSDAYRVYYKKLEVLFVIRGSDRDSDWTRNNARIAINARPAKLHEVYNHCQFFKRLSPRSDFYITGHSLGGGLTQVVGYYTDSMFVAFNPPSMRNSVTGNCNMKPKAAPEPKMKPKDFDKGCVIRSADDAVSRFTTGKFIGMDYLIPTAAAPVGENGVRKNGALWGHSMEAIIGAIASRSVPGLSPQTTLDLIADKAETQRRVG